MSDPVHSPAHYKAGDLDCRDVQRALQRTLWSGSEYAHELCNALKYLFRCTSKGKFAEDIKKAAYECLSCVDEEWRMRVAPGSVPTKAERFAVAIRDEYEWEDHQGDWGRATGPEDHDGPPFISASSCGVYLSATECRELAAHLNAWAQQWEESNK